MLLSLPFSLYPLLPFLYGLWRPSGIAWLLLKALTWVASLVTFIVLVAQDHFTWPRTLWLAWCLLHLFVVQGASQDSHFRKWFTLWHDPDLDAVPETTASDVSADEMTSRCPFCGNTFTADASDAGLYVPCPHCGDEIKMEIQNRA